MKKIFSFIFLILTFVTIVNADNVRIISQSGNSIVVQRTYTQTETAQYQRVDNSYNQPYSSYYNTQYKPGNVGLAFHAGYGFNYGFEFGGQIYYNFAAKEKVKFGVSLGFDYGKHQWWNCRDPRYTDGNFGNDTKYWDMRAGIIICKYLGLGGIYGKFNGYDGTSYNDGGLYGTIYLPFCQWFGLNFDAKWTKYQGATIGGGIILQLNTKYTE